MLHKDRLIFALLLARIHLRAAQGETPLDQEFKVLMRYSVFLYFCICPPG